MSQTLRRELRQKFVEILVGTIDHMDGAFTTDEIAEKLTDAALELRGFSKPAVNLKNADPAWSILAGEAIVIDPIIEEAKDAFERGLRFNPLPWGMNKQWDKLEKFVVQEYKKDALIFIKYKTWQEGDGKYVALSNRKIKEKPEDFIACFPDFLAHVEMYSKPKQDGSSGFYA